MPCCADSRASDSSWAWVRNSFEIAVLSRCLPSIAPVSDTDATAPRPGSVSPPPAPLPGPCRDRRRPRSPARSGRPRRDRAMPRIPAGALRTRCAPRAFCSAAYCSRIACLRSSSRAIAPAHGPAPSRCRPANAWLESPSRQALDTVPYSRTRSVGGNRSLDASAPNLASNGGVANRTFASRPASRPSRRARSSLSTSRYWRRSPRTLSSPPSRGYFSAYSFTTASSASGVSRSSSVLMVAFRRSMAARYTESSFCSLRRWLSASAYASLNSGT